MTDDLALCKCGIDITMHDNVTDHPFDAAGTRHRCAALLVTGYLCALPRYHEQDGIPHGPVKGRWVINP